MKKILLMLSIMLMPMVYFSQSAYADSGCTGNETFFGLPAWYRGLVTSGENGCQIKEIGPNDSKNKHEITIEQFVWTVVANVIDMGFRIAGLVAMAFIIYAGYQYMIAAGDPGMLANAKKSLTNAVVGLVIAILASTIVTFVLGILG